MTVLTPALADEPTAVLDRLDAETGDDTVVTTALTRQRPRPAVPPRLAALLAAPVAVVAALVAAFGVNRPQMSNDELATWHAATLTWPDFWRLLGTVDAVHGLYYVLMRLWLPVAGDSTTALRAPSVAAAAVAAAAVVLLGVRLFGPQTGVVAGLLFTAVPAVSSAAQDARSYSMVIALSVVATLALLRALEWPTWRRWAVYGVLILALGYLHFVALLVLAAHLLLFRATWRGTSDMRVWRWLAPLTVAVAGMVPLLSIADGQSAQIGWIKADGKAISRFPLELSGSMSLALVLVGLALIACTASAVLPRRFRIGPLASLLVWALLPPVFVYATFPVLHMFLARYVLFALPAWALLAAVGVTRAAAIARLRHPAGLAVVQLVVVAAAAYLALPGQAAARASFDPDAQDYRSALAVVIAEARPGDGIAFNVAAAPSRPRRTLRYELRDRSTWPVADVFLTRPAAANGSFDDSECEQWRVCASGVQRLWLLSVNYSPDPWYGLPPSRRDLGADFKAERTWHFPGSLTVSLMARPAPAGR